MDYRNKNTVIITPKLPLVKSIVGVYTICCGGGVMVRIWLLEYACPLLSAKPRGRGATRKYGCSRSGARPTTWVGSMYLSLVLPLLSLQNKKSSSRSACKYTGRPMSRSSAEWACQTRLSESPQPFNKFGTR
ncbi:hypothetical protein CsSME_00048642 [Camellia sinensis var. sinensis]